MILHHRRDLAFSFGYGHFVVFGSITAVGAGLHVAALYLEHEAHVSALAVTWTIAIPVLLFTISTTGLFSRLLGLRSRNLIVTALKTAIVLAAVGMASAGVGLAWCVLVMSLAPALGVAVAELGGGRLMVGHIEKAIADHNC